MTRPRNQRVQDAQRPFIYVLAGVNGAGKSSLLGGYILTEDKGLPWFNPDEYARELADATGMELERANGEAWNEGLKRLRHAIAERHSYSFETTLGGRTLSAELIRAAATHDIHLYYCGLPDVDAHLRRIARRVARGGHPIPEAKVRERFTASPRNLIAVMPHLSSLSVYDNSAELTSDGIAPEPKLVLMLTDGHWVYPKTRKHLAATPEWAKPIVMAALDLVPNPFTAAADTGD